MDSETRPTAVSLFSGCGGSDLALVQAGFRVVWANDISEVACRTYEDNIPGSQIKAGDISDFVNFPNAQLLVGCYPCQGYSQAGRRKINVPVNFLYRQFDRVLRTIRPRAFVVENVSGMSNSSNRQLLKNQLVRYRLAGYKVKWKKLDAKDYGVAQTRKRVFIVGLRSDLEVEYDLPPPTHGPLGQNGYLTQRDTLRALPPWPEGDFCAEAFHWY